MHKLKRLFLNTIAIGSLVFLSTCSNLDGGFDEIRWQMNFDLVKTSWDVQFKDAASGELIGNDSDLRVEVYLTGPDQSNILDLAGIRQERFYSTKGFLGLILHPDQTEPSENTPVQFTLHAKIDGYLPVHVPIEAYSTGINPVEVMLVNLELSPIGVNVLHLENAGKFVFGLLHDSISLYTPGNRLEVIIPRGIQMLDKNGEALSGNMDVTIALWDGMIESAVEALPGGPLALLDINDYKIAIKQPASQLFLVIKDQYGKEAVSFSENIRATFLLDPMVFNPEEKRLIWPDDILPVYLLNDQNGSWSQESIVSLESFQNKVLAKINLQKTGTFHFGWMDRNYCQYPLNLEFTTLPEYNTLPYSFRLKLYRNVNGIFQYLYSFGITGAASESSQMRYLPVGSELILRFEPYLDCAKPYYKTPDAVLLTGECSEHPILQNDLIPIPPGEIRELQVVFIDTEHNNTNYIPSLLAGYYRNHDSDCWQSAMVYQGITYLFNVEPGEVYELGINYKGEYHYEELSITDSGTMYVEIEIN